MKHGPRTPALVRGKSPSAGVRCPLSAPGSKDETESVLLRFNLPPIDMEFAAQLEQAKLKPIWVLDLDDSLRRSIESLTRGCQGSFVMICSESMLNFELEATLGHFQGTRRRIYYVRSSDASQLRFAVQGEGSSNESKIADETTALLALCKHQPCLKDLVANPLFLPRFARVLRQVVNAIPPLSRSLGDLIRAEEKSDAKSSAESDDTETSDELISESYEWKDIEALRVRHVDILEHTFQCIISQTLAELKAKGELGAVDASTVASEYLVLSEAIAMYELMGTSADPRVKRLLHQSSAANNPTKALQYCALPVTCCVVGTQMKAVMLSPLIQKYFVAKSTIRTITELNASNVSIDEMVSVLARGPLGLFVFTHDRDMLRLQAELLSKSMRDVNMCIKVILNTRTSYAARLDEPSMLVAGNLISVLNAIETLELADFQLSQCETDWNSVRIPYANLSGANLNECNFENALLHNVNLVGASIHHTSFVRARMHKLRWSNTLVKLTSSTSLHTFSGSVGAKWENRKIQLFHTYDLTAYQEIVPEVAPQDTVTALAISPAAQLVAVRVACTSILVYSVATQSLLRNTVLLGAPNCKEITLKFSPNARYIVCVEDGKAALWDLASDKPPAVLKAEGGCTGICLAEFSPDSRYLVLVYSNRVQLWRTTTAEFVELYRNGVLSLEGTPRALCFGSGSTLYIGVEVDSPHRVLVYDMAAGLCASARKASDDQKSPTRPSVDVYDLAWISNRLIVARYVTESSFIELSDGHTGDVIQQLTCGCDKIVRLTFIDQGRWLVATSAANEILAWDICAHMDALHAPRSLKSTPKQIVFDPARPNNCLLIWYTDNSLRVWYPDSRRYGGFVRFAHAPFACASNDERGLMAVQFSNTNVLELWDIKAGKRIEARPFKLNRWIKMNFTRDGTELVAISDSLTLSGLDVQTLEIKYVIPFRSDQDQGLRLAKLNDDQTMDLAIYQSTGNVRSCTIDLNSQSIETSTLLKGEYTSITFVHPVTKRVGALFRGQSGLYEFRVLESMSDLQPKFTVRSTSVDNGTISPQGNYLCVLDKEGTLSIWHFEVGLLASRVSTMHGPYAQIFFMTESRVCILARNGSIQIWDFPYDKSQPAHEKRFGLWYSYYQTPGQAKLILDIRKFESALQLDQGVHDAIQSQVRYITTSNPQLIRTEYAQTAAQPPPEEDSSDDVQACCCCLLAVLLGVLGARAARHVDNV